MTVELSPPRRNRAQGHHPGLSCTQGAAPTFFTDAEKTQNITQKLWNATGFFARHRYLDKRGVWVGPRDAVDSVVDASNLAALGGVEAAWKAGARVLITAHNDENTQVAAAMGMRIVMRLIYAACDTQEERKRAIDEIAGAIASGLKVESVLPTPTGEPLGLDTMNVFTCLRRSLGEAPVHIGADFASLGHRSAQMALLFGADHLWGPIVAERSLRVGDNAGNPAMTRKEAALLLSGAGLVPHERTGAEQFEAIS